MSTAHNLTPEEMFYRNVDIVGEEQVEDDYGAKDDRVDVDDNYTLLGDDHYLMLHEGVPVEPVRCSLNAEQMEFFCSFVSPIPSDVVDRYEVISIVQNAFLWFHNASIY